MYFIGRLIKLILDTLINGYAPHTVYRWSIHLLDVICDSLTQLLLFKGGAPKHQDTPPINEAIHRSITPTTSKHSPQPIRRTLYPILSGDLDMAEIPLLPVGPLRTQ
ncbi:hypothetical protein WH47_10765 [Habropoda laboriosa]|uniref:Uncharacterized protein n=1 Tax=Habropoda laboriosa TaxID=597456 RepID=A0A0L7QMX6_9HYME|nr:hypothetical protein WH47_10765 [Habropoda laboriosa]